MPLLEIMQLLHYIGIAWGVGGATVAVILMAKSEKIPESAPHIMRFMPTLSRLIWLGFILLVVSGIALSQLVTEPLNMTIFAAKLAVVLLLLIHGINMSLRLVPKMARLSPKGREPPSEEFLKTKRKAKIHGAIGLALWYIIVILGVMM